MKRSKSLLRSIAVVLASVMAYEAVATPLAQAAMLPAQMPALRLPMTVGSTIEVYAPKKPARLVYHLQDVHGDVGAQTNLAEMVSLLESHAASQGKFLVVAVEGASGPIDSDSIAKMTDQKAKEEVAAGLLRAGYMMGEEYAAITHAPGRIKLVGLETSDLYNRNVQARDTSAQARARVLATFKEIHGQLEKLKPHNFNATLAALEKKRQEVEAGTFPLSEYVAFLNRINPDQIKRHPHLTRFVALAEAEAAIDFKQVEAKDKAEVRKHEAYLAASKAIDTESLFAEVETAGAAISEGLIKHPLAQQLYNLSRWVETQERFFSLSLTSDEWESMRSIDMTEIYRRHAQIRNFVREQTMDLGYDFEPPIFSYDDLKPAMQGARGFYEAAVSRDVSMVANLEKILNEYPEKKAVVAFIAGGFHTPGVTRLLRSRSLAYEVVRPQIESQISLEKGFEFPRRKVDFLRNRGALPEDGMIGAQRLAQAIENPKSLARELAAKAPVEVVLATSDDGSFAVNAALKRLQDLGRPERANMGLLGLALNALIGVLTLGYAVMRRSWNRQRGVTIQPRDIAGGSFTSEVYRLALKSVEDNMLDFLNAISGVSRKIVRRDASVPVTIVIDADTYVSKELEAGVENMRGLLSKLGSVAEKKNFIPGSQIVVASKSNNPTNVNILKSAIGTRRIFAKATFSYVVADTGSNITDLLKAGGLTAQPNQTFVLTADPLEEYHGGQKVMAAGIPMLTLATYAYTHFKNPNFAFKELIRLFETLTPLRMNGTITDQVILRLQQLIQA